MCSSDLYDIFVSMKLIEAEAQAMDQFGSTFTVAQLAKNADPEKVRQTLLGKYMNYWKDWKKDSDGVSFMWGCQFMRWDQIHFTADSVDIFKHGNRTLVNILLVVALVLLLSALFNYINLTVAQIGNRAWTEPGRARSRSWQRRAAGRRCCRRPQQIDAFRSEEHTSELQSLS